MVAFAALLLMFPQEIPLLPTPVHDAGGVLYPEDEETALHMIRKIEESHGVRFALVTVNRTGERSIEEFTADVATRNALGPSGVLIVVAVKDRMARVAVGADAEENLPESLRDRIITDEMVPHFIHGRIGAGAFAGLAALVTAVRGDYKVRPRLTRYYRRRSLIPWWGYGLIVLIYLVSIHRKLGESGGGFAIGRSAYRVGRSPQFQGSGASGRWC